MDASVFYLVYPHSFGYSFLMSFRLLCSREAPVFHFDLMENILWFQLDDKGFLINAQLNKLNGLIARYETNAKRYNSTERSSFK